MPKYSLGHKARLYYSANGTTWTLVKGVRDVTVNVSSDEADVTTRDNDGWKANAKTLKDASIEFQILPAPGEATYEALRDANFADTVLRFRALSDLATVDNAEGLMFWGQVFSWNRSEALADAQMIDVSTKPTIPPDGKEAETPTWVEIEV